jgi:hypothetical protein
MLSGWAIFLTALDTAPPGRVTMAKAKINFKLEMDTVST